MKLVRKKEVWRPTFLGYAILLLLLGGLGGIAILNLYPFLAQTVPQPSAEIVIMEGWLPDAELGEAAKAAGPGQLIVTTGGPVNFGGSLFKGKTYAEITADRLYLMGIDTERILCAPAPDARCDRTYTSSLAVRRALVQRGLFGKPCTVYSVGAHSRRSLYLYKLAFGADYPIGIVALEGQEYDLRHWWRSSLAFKQVLGELFSWIYTLFSSCKYA